MLLTDLKQYQFTTPGDENGWNIDIEEKYIIQSDMLHFMYRKKQQSF